MKKVFKDITPADITKWKQTKGKLKEINVPLAGEEDKTANFIICKPTRDTLEALIDASKNEDEDLAQKLLILNCVLGGDMKYLDRDDKESDTAVFLAVLEEVGKFMKAPKVKSKFI